MRTNSRPRVSIGLPVYNGEAFLADALESALAQTFTDFELIICDNASTDNTAEICRSFVQRDPRVRYFRSGQNLGAAPNFNNAFARSCGDYFKWLAHDDLIAPTFLERCVEVLDANEGVAIACPKTVFVGSDGRSFVKEAMSSGVLRSTKGSERLRHLLYDTDRHWVFGLIRASALRETSLIGNYTDSDGNLLVELGLRGAFYEVPEQLQFLREHNQRSIYAHAHFTSRDAWFETRKASTVNFPAWRALREYHRAIVTVDLPASERIRSYASIANWVCRYRWRVLGGQVKYNLIKQVSSVIGTRTPRRIPALTTTRQEAE